MTPKEHVDHFTDVPESIAGRMTVCAHRLGRIFRKELQPLRVGFIISGFGVSHAHLIVLPLHQEHDITSARFAQVVDGELLFNESAVQEWSRKELDRMAERLRRVVISSAEPKP